MQPLGWKELGKAASSQKSKKKPTSLEPKKKGGKRKGRMSVKGALGWAKKEAKELENGQKGPGEIHLWCQPDGKKGGRECLAKKGGRNE